jgi:hypothetical protein
VRTFVIGVAVAVIAAVVDVVFAASEGLSGRDHWAVVLGLGLVAVLAASLAARKVQHDPEVRTTVAKGVRAKGNVLVQGIRVHGRRSRSTEVATDIRSRGDVQVKDVQVVDPEPDEPAPHKK